MVVGWSVEFIIEKKNSPVTLYSISWHIILLETRQVFMAFGFFPCIKVILFSPKAF